MKKFTLLFAVLIGLIANAQDTATIKAFVASPTLEQIKSASDKIAASAAEKFEYFKTTDRSLRDEKFKVVVYTPASFTTEDKKEFTSEEKAKCLIVVWRVTNDGFAFSEVTNQEQNLKPFWSSTFSATENDYRFDKDIKYKYVKNENSVSIVKSY